MISQKNIVLNHLREKGGITSLEAINNYGITRLSGVIWSLKHDGYQIKSKLTEVKNRYGGKSHVSVYTLK